MAVWLAEGRTVPEMAAAAGHTRDAIHRHLKQICQKRSISPQAELVRLVPSLAKLGCSGLPGASVGRPVAALFLPNTTNLGSDRRNEDSLA